MQSASAPCKNWQVQGSTFPWVCNGFLSSVIEEDTDTDEEEIISVEGEKISFWEKLKIVVLALIYNLIIYEDTTSLLYFALHILQTTILFTKIVKKTFNFKTIIIITSRLYGKMFCWVVLWWKRIINIRSRNQNKHFPLQWTYGHI